MTDMDAVTAVNDRLDLDEDQRFFKDSVERTIQRVSPLSRVQQLDNAKEFDTELHAALGELGVLGLGVPEADGGSGGGAVEQVIALHTLARLATSSAVSSVVQYMINRLLREFGSPAQKERFLRPVASGAAKASFCLTESGGGTDILASMKTKATRRPDGGWVLNGTKMWISGAMRSDFLIVLARTAEHRSRGLSMFIVPKDTPGIAAHELNTFAINSYDTCEVSFSDVALPNDSLLGVIDNGFPQVVSTLNAERINAAAAAVGIAQGALERAVEYARERHAFGRPLGQFQAIQHRLVQTGVQIEAAWLLTMRAAKDDGLGKATDVASSMAKLAASKAAQAATHVGMEVLGGAAFDTALPMQRYYRDARLYVFAPLTDDMTTNLLGERWLGLPRSF